MNFDVFDIVLVKQPDNSTIITRLTDIDNDKCIGVALDDYTGNEYHLIEFNFSDIIRLPDGVYGATLLDLHTSKTKQAQCKIKNSKEETFIIDGKETDITDTPFILTALYKLDKKLNFSNKTVKLEEGLFL